MTEYRSYEDYDTSSSFYDQTRTALGVDIILGVLSAHVGSPRGLSVVDIGCGTGNYLAALAPHMGELVGLEYSSGMLSQARHKTAGLEPVRLVRGSAFGLPFTDNRFQAALLNQVVHHFDTGGDSTDPGAFPMLRQALGEVFRALAPGGVIMLNHVTQKQLFAGYWWVPLFPEAMARMGRRYIALPALRGMLEEIGYDYGGAIVPLDDVLQAKGYFDTRGPLDPDWRRGDSTWTLATDEELAAGQRQLRELHESGAIDSWMAEREASRKESGQSVFVWARKPGQAA